MPYSFSMWRARDYLKPINPPGNKGDAREGIRPELRTQYYA